MDSRPIGFLDSGVGGLSLLSAAQRLMPGERCLMLADGGHFPYGESEPSRVCDRAERLARYLLDQNAKLIVVACNTASVHALAGLRETFPDVPFVGVVPVVKTLAQRTRTGTIAVLSTPATAESPYLADLVRNFASGKRVLSIGCAGLAERVEEGDLDSPGLLSVLRDALRDVASSNADVLGLGCTHYFFLRVAMKAALGSSVRIFDPSRPVARRIRQVLSERGMLREGGQGSAVYCTTGDPLRFRTVVSRLLRHPVADARGIDI